MLHPECMRCMHDQTAKMMVFPSADFVKRPDMHTVMSVHAIRGMAHLSVMTGRLQRLAGLVDARVLFFYKALWRKRIVMAIVCCHCRSLGCVKTRLAWQAVVVVGYGPQAPRMFDS